MTRLTHKAAAICSALFLTLTPVSAIVTVPAAQAMPFAPMIA